MARPGQAIRHLPRTLFRRTPPGFQSTVRGLLSSTGSVVTSEDIFALTLDDGPDPEVTPQVLDSLAEAEWQATFFVLVDRAEQHPSITRRILDEGHEIGLHAGSHLSLPGQDLPSKTRLILRAKRRLEALTDCRVRTFRPPYGKLDPSSFALARLGRLQVIAWSAQVDDWTCQSAEALTQRLVRATAPGSFVLVHDGLVRDPDDPPTPSASARAEWLPRGIARLNEHGFRSHTVTDITGAWPAVRFPWFVPSASGGVTKPLKHRPEWPICRMFPRSRS